MHVSWQLANAYYIPDCLQAIIVADLPLAVCGVLCSLLPSDAPDGVPLRASLACRLRYELRPEWMRQADLGTICAVINGLHSYDPTMVSGSDLALVAQRLIGSEAAVGGPYYSHLSEGKGSSNAPDPLTNALAAQCLSWLAAPLPNVMAFVAGAVTEIDLVELNEWGLFIALAATSGATQVQPHPQVLYAQLQAHADLFCAALCLRIIDSSRRHLSVNRQIQNIYPAIHTFCMQQLPATSDTFAGNTRTMLEHVVQADNNHEISQLAWYYGTALAQTPTVTKDVYERLGMANIYAWAAYTIYDDFLDEEGEPTMLGTANFSVRAMLRHYRWALPDEAYQRFVESALTMVDAANTLETSSFRFSSSAQTITVGRLPDFGQRDLLADRALFHVLGPMGVLAATGVPVASDIWNNTLLAFRHYLIARQLNDDVHDWVKDLQAGQATYVVVELLRYLNVTPGTYAFAELLPYARQQFWQYVLPQVCDTALGHITTAHQALRGGLPLTTQNHITSLFDYVENSMYAAQSLRVQSRDMLQTLSF